MKRSLVFTSAEYNLISEYPPPLISPFTRQPAGVATKKMRRDFLLLLGRYKRAGNELAQHWQQNTDD